MLLERGGLLEGAFLIVHVHCRQSGSRSDRVARIGVAVEQFDHIFGAVHEGIVDRVAHQHCAHGNNTVGEALGGCDDVRCNTKALRAERPRQAPESSNDFVKNQQDAMLVADLSQTFEITDWRR